MENQYYSATDNKEAYLDEKRRHLTGQKPPLKLKEIWAIRTKLEMAHRVRDLAMFNLAIDSKLRGCDLLRLKVRDLTNGNQILPRVKIIQRKTGQPVKFEVTQTTQDSLNDWIKYRRLSHDDFLFPSSHKPGEHLTTRHYGRIVKSWVESIGLDPRDYGSHSMRRTKPTLIYRRTKNIRAVQLLLGHTKLDSTVQYLGIELDDALEISEQTEV
jgi:integrase